MEEKVGMRVFLCERKVRMGITEVYECNHKRNCRIDKKRLVYIFAKTWVGEVKITNRDVIAQIFSCF